MDRQYPQECQVRPATHWPHLFCQAGKESIFRCRVWDGPFRVGTPDQKAGPGALHAKEFICVPSLPRSRGTRLSSQASPARLVMARQGMVAAWYDGPNAPIGCTLDWSEPRILQMAVGLGSTCKGKNDWSARDPLSRPALRITAQTEHYVLQGFFS